MTTEETKKIENLFNLWCTQQRKDYPTWLELSVYMFEAGVNHQKENNEKLYTHNS